MPKDEGEFEDCGAGDGGWVENEGDDDGNCERVDGGPDNESKLRGGDDDGNGDDEVVGAPVKPAQFTMERKKINRTRRRESFQPTNLREGLAATP